MRKRKFPAGLLVLLVVMLGGAGAYSAYNSKIANMTPEEANRMMQEQATSSAPPKSEPQLPDKNAVRSQIQAGLSKGSGEEGATQEGGPGPAAPTPGSSIVVPKSQPYKPVPNESGTPSQWYKTR